MDGTWGLSNLTTGFGKHIPFSNPVAQKGHHNIRTLIENCSIRTDEAILDKN